MFTTKTNLLGLFIPSTKGRFRQAAALVTHPDVRNTFLATAAAVVADQLFPAQKTSFAEYATCGALLLGHTTFIEKYFLILPNFQEAWNNKLAIETKPASDQMTDLEKHGEGIVNMRTYFGYGSRSYPAVIMAGAALSAGANPLGGLALAFAFIPSCLHFWNGHKRWKNIDKGDWVLGAYPKQKEPVPVRAKLRAFFEKPVAAPSKI